MKKPRSTRPTQLTRPLSTDQLAAVTGGGIGTTAGMLPDPTPMVIKQR